MKVIKDAKYYAALNSIRENILKQIKLNFTGSSPPEIFVGEFNYPNIYTGILSPIKHDESSFKLSSPEDWFKARLNEKEILLSRASMVYSRFISNVRLCNKLTNVMQEVSMSSRPIDVNFELKKKPSLGFSFDNFHKPIFNPAPLKKAVVEENPCVAKRVDYIVSDIDMKAGEAILDLYKHNLTVSSINKLLSAGLLGINIQRKLVPTKWAITCVDDTISKNLVEKIKNYDAVSEYLVFYDEYLGNHYEILLIPKFWSFEVIEISLKGGIWKDYESFFKRKNYAKSVAGGYYSARLSSGEYLNKIKKQAAVLILREVSPEYNSLGVGILRETMKSAFSKPPKRFNTLQDALKDIQKRLKLSIQKYTGESQLLKDLQQKTLQQFI